MRKTSAADREPLPKSLRERLALLERGVLLVPRPKTHADSWQPSCGSRQRLFGASFGLGLACGGLLGSVALLALLLMHPEPAWPRQMSTPADATQGAAATALPDSTLEMIIRRSHDGKALFPLHVTGAENTDSVRVVLRDLPETVRLSNGERQDERTWGLRLADLEGLYVTLGEGTPDAFDVTIEVASAAGMQVAKTVAHVRLAGRREVVAAPVLSRSTAATIEDLLRQPVAPSFRTDVVRSAPRVEELAAAALPRPPLPGGVSSLGGPKGDGSGEPAPSVEGRKVWWRMPTPGTAWTPFGNGASGN